MIAESIALIDEDSFSGLKYVFDISDVHKARRIGQFPNLWEMREEHMESVISRLEKTYGDTDREAGFVGRIREIAERIAEDCYKELASDMEYLKEGSFLEEQVGTIAAAEASIQYTMPAAFSLPQEQIDSILCSGGGRDNSRKRIYAKYQQGKTPEEMAEFLKNEYKTTGKGFEFDGNPVSRWFDEMGMRISYGTSAKENPLAVMSWSGFVLFTRCTGCFGL